MREINAILLSLCLTLNLKFQSTIFRLDSGKTLGVMAQSKNKR